MQKSVRFVQNSVQISPYPYEHFFLKKSGRFFKTRDEFRLPRSSTCFFQKSGRFFFNSGRTCHFTKNSFLYFEEIKNQKIIVIFTYKTTVLFFCCCFSNRCCFFLWGALFDPKDFREKKCKGSRQYSRRYDPIIHEKSGRSWTKTPVSSSAGEGPL